MNKVNWKQLSCQEIASLICEHLRKHEFDATLTGGACVSIYSNEKYLSGDLDFVMGIDDLKKLNKTMALIGFSKEGRMRHYVSKSCPYFVEFPPGPLSIGEQIITKPSQLNSNYGILKLLSPTDCVKDRLAAYYHWNDQQSLDQAVMVAKDNKINIKDVERWSLKERNLEKFQEFVRLIKTSHA